MIRMKVVKVNKKAVAGIIGALLAALMLILFWDRLLSAFFSPGGLVARAMPAAIGMGVPVETEEPEQLRVQEQLIRFEVLEVEEDVSEEIRIELLGTQSGSDVNLAGAEPKILIYHTHTTEAYAQTEQDPYVETTEFRSNDTEHNIVRVGEALASVLREKYGISVIHDTTNHEPPRLGTSYERSIKTMEAYHEQYPSIELFIDVHRDAYTLKEGEVNTDYATVDGKRCARLMFVVGTGEGKTGAGFSVKPNYQVNYALALEIYEKLTGKNEKLTRPIRVKTGRYNQHIPGKALLVEVGHNANTLEEALNSIPYLAEAIASCGN